MERGHAKASESRGPTPSEEEAAGTEAGRGGRRGRGVDPQDEASYGRPLARSSYPLASRPAAGGRGVRPGGLREQVIGDYGAVIIDTEVVGVVSSWYLRQG